MQFEHPRRIVIPKRGFSREESAVSLQAESRFLADKPGFGMTRGRVIRVHCSSTIVALRMPTHEKLEA